MEVLTAAAALPVQVAVASELARRGVGPGERIALVAPMSGAGLCAVLGALRVGVVPVLLNPALLRHELDALLAAADVSLTWGAAELAAVAAGADERGPRRAELAEVPLGRPMHFTSGTTGTPKGVWAGVWDERSAARWLGDEQEQWRFEPADRHLVCGPLHHSAPVRFATGTLMAGGTVVLPGPFDAPRHAAAIVEHRTTAAFLAPVHLQRLLALPDPPPLTSFRLLAHAGAPCPPPVKRAALAAAHPGVVWEFYGATEGQVSACSPEEWLERPGTVGRARAGRRLSVDEDGTIWTHTPAHGRFEYFRDPARTAAAWRGDAFTVGDLGRLDGDGYLYLDGRRDDLIISGGVNVYPAEVEAALAECPGIEAVAVFPRDDPAWGQRVCAAYVGDVAPEVLGTWARTVLAAYKCPKEAARVDAIPTTPAGKVRRSTLAEDLGLR